ncbi:MAG: IspD/TarI family cytidylyltransferase, partial [Actinomycetota bacterium]
MTAILLAAGRGERAGGGVPKQFLSLAGRPMLAHSLLAFEAAPAVDSVVVVLPPRRPSYAERAISSPKIWAAVSGGETRQASLTSG